MKARSEDKGIASSKEALYRLIAYQISEEDFAPVRPASSVQRAVQGAANAAVEAASIR